MVIIIVIDNNRNI